MKICSVSWKIWKGFSFRFRHFSLNIRSLQMFVLHHKIKKMFVHAHQKLLPYTQAAGGSPMATLAVLEGQSPAGQRWYTSRPPVVTLPRWTR